MYVAKKYSNPDKLDSTRKNLEYLITQVHTNANVLIIAIERLNECSPVCLGQTQILIGMLWKGVVKSSLLFNDEHLTPKIDKIMPLQFFRRRTQTTKNGKNGLYLFLSHKSYSPRALQTYALGK